jgi:spermidine synthase
MTADKKIREHSPQEEREYHTSSAGLFFKVDRLLSKKESPYQKIEVIENEYFGRILLLDGLVQTTERDEFFYHEMLVHPAFLVHPEPKEILIIGGGDGGVLKEILRYPVQSVHLVEIDSQVIEVSQKYFPWLSAGLKDRRTELVIADGREWIERTDRKFDIVCVDSSDPVGPSTTLHEKDFFQNMKFCLNKDAVIAAQAGSLFYQPEEIQKKNEFLRKLFKHVFFYTSPVPTYPGGSWSFVFVSDETHPLRIKRDAPEGLKYFNPDIHRAAFALPNFLKEKLG